MAAEHTEPGTTSNEYPNVFAPETLALHPAGCLWSPTLPPELWLSVFPHVGDADLRSITLTCLDFRILAQPLLFQVLDVSPFFLAYNADRPIFRPRRYLQRTLERLQFYKSSRIAPSVTHLWVSPYSRRGFPTRRLSDDLNPTLIVSAVIDSLPSFPSIRELTWHCFDIQSPWWLELRRLPLTRMWINSCSIVSPTPGTSLHPLSPFPRIITLDLDQWAWEGEVTNHVSIHEERLYGVDTDVLSLTINPEYIHSISIPRNDTALRLLDILKSLNPNIPCLLSSLTIPYTCIPSDDFVPALMRLDMLSELHILPPSEIQNAEGSLTNNNNNLITAPLPHLEVYEGPYHLLPSFINRSHPRYQTTHQLRSLVLWGLDERPESTVCDPHLLVQVLKELAQRDDAIEALETVHFSLTHITLELATFLEQFRHLEEIFIETQDSLMPDRNVPSSAFELAPESPITVLYVILRSQQFSPTLTHLTLVTHLKNTSNLNNATQRHEAAKFLEELGRVNPQLDKIDLKYGTYWTGVVDIKWRRRLLSKPPLDEQVGNLLTSNPGLFSRSSSSDSSHSRSNSEPLITNDTNVTTVTAMDPSLRNSNERFVQLPSRPKITTTIDVGIGQISFIEQRRSMVLPERVLPLNQTIENSNSTGWVSGSVRRILNFLGSVGVVIKGGVGFVRGGGV